MVDHGGTYNLFHEIRKNVLWQSRAKVLRWLSTDHSMVASSPRLEVRVVEEFSDRESWKDSLNQIVQT